MGNASKHQLDYWNAALTKKYGLIFCACCGFSEDNAHQFKTKDKHSRKFTGLIVDKINNDGNHNIIDNVVEDFQHLCHSCNTWKNPRGKQKPEKLKMTLSEKKNKNAEKPMMEDLKLRLEAGEIIEWDQWVCDAAFEYDVSVEPTIKERYYAKYFKSRKGPFALYTGNFDKEYIGLKGSIPPSNNAKF